MPKRRQFVPLSDRDGIWFSHRGSSYTEPIMRTTHTSIGIMHSEPLINPNYPPIPTEIYKEKYTKNFKTSNKFSDHDNRHSHQDRGIYFGNGKDTRYYGKLLLSPSSRQHHTDTDFLKHFGRHVVNHDYHTLYRTDFEGLANDQRLSTRRYPRNHKEGSPGTAELSTQTTLHCDNESYITDLQVLATSQQPFLKHNNWKYSYHGSPNCYPSLPDKVNQNLSWPAK